MNGKAIARERSLRQATVRDLDALVHLEEAGFPTDQFSRRRLRYLLTRANATVLVLEQEGLVVGAAIMVWRRHSTAGHLYSIVVDPALQGQGLGVRLLQACEKEALERWCSRLVLEVRADNVRAIQMYSSQGYIVRATIPDLYSDGATGLRMEKALGQQARSTPARP
ncbi:MAG: GNAT family N-acetyltransferase [Chloroflexi bacterium]|nr:GNAT family N-acetyltransferase [Chloroflexota bacterium]